MQERMDGVDIHRYHYAPETMETLVNNGGISGNLKKSPWKWLLVPGFLLSQWWHTVRLIKRLKPDMVHAHWIIPQGLVLFLTLPFTAKVPFVLTSHGADLFTLKGGIMARLKARILKHAASVTVVSEPMHQQVLRLGVADERIAVMPMGVDFDKFTPSADVIRNPNEILFVGRLVEKKGLAYLIRALDYVRREIPDVSLLIIGFGPEEQALRKLSTELGIADCVHFLGPKSQADLINYYRRAELFIAPFVEAKDGDQEGLGLVTIEAIACGCPVLVGDVVAVKNLPIENLDVRNINEFALKICINMKKEISNLEAIRNSMEKNFSWNSVSKKYSQILAGNIKS